MDLDDDAALDGGDDLRSALASALDGDGGSAGAEVGPERHETKPDGSDAGAATPAAARHRSPDGRYAEKPADAPAPATTEQPQAPAAAQAATPATTPAATKPAPQSWTAENKQGWGSLPPAIQDQVLKREDEVNRALNDSASARRFTSAIEQIVTPHAQLLQREGVDVPTCVSNLLSFHAFFDRDPAGCIAHLQQLAIQRGHKPSGAPQGGAVPPQQPAAPPRQAPQPIDVQRLVRDELAAHSQRQSIDSEIAAFARANPHFEAVRPTMATLLRTAQASGQPMTMQDAYDRAIWSDPAIRPALLAAQAAPAAPQVQPAAAPARSAADQAAGVARARQAGGSVRGAPGGAAPKPADRSLRETIADAFEGR